MRSLPKQFIIRLCLTAIVISVAAPASAQTGKLELKNLEKLADKAAEVNDITLDGSLLQLAVRMMENSHDADAAQVKDLVKDLKGIYVKNFEFDSPGQYSQADVEAIRTQLAAPGWQRVVTSRSKRTGENNEIYLLKQGDKINGIAILVAEPRELSVVNIVGAIDPEKLGELGGHFGIPDQIGDHPPNPKLVPRKNGMKGSTGANEKKESGHEQPMD